MELKRVSEKLARRLKLIKFPQNPYRIDMAYCPTYIDGSKIILRHSLFAPESNIAIAPTLELAKMWFRDVHSIHITVDKSAFSQTYNFVLKGKYDKSNDGILYRDRYAKYESHDKALEDGLLEAVEIILNK